MSPIASNVSVTRLESPNLEDTSKYIKIPKVPILDVHEREFYRSFTDENGNTRQRPVVESVDEDQLSRLARNSEERARSGEYGIVFLGHTDDDGKETDQPPVKGLMKNYTVAKHNGRPTIHADIYIRGDKNSYDSIDSLKDEVSNLWFQYPRRSAEVIRKNYPDGFIDSIALIKRSPERSLGVFDLYSYNRKDVDRFICVGCEAERGKMSLTNEDMNKLTKVFMRGLSFMLEKVLGEEAEQVGDIDSEEDRLEEEVHPGIHEEVKEEKPELEAEEEERDEVPEEHRQAARAAGIDAPEEDKEKYCSGGSTPGPTTSMPSMGREKEKNHMNNRYISNAEKNRMKKDQENIEVSRYQRDLAERDRRIEALEARLRDTDRKARINSVERRVVQLEAEGFEIDRPMLMDRFSASIDRMSDEEVDKEFQFIKSISRRSPVGQPMIFGGEIGSDIMADSGGHSDSGSSERTRYQRNFKDHESVNTGSETFGEGVVRFARNNNPRSVNPIDKALEAVAGFREKKTS